jgi:Spy/CpxP family protein refolding chaperone
MTKTGRIRAWIVLLVVLTFASGGTVVFALQSLLSQEDTRALPGDEWRGELGRNLSLSAEQDAELARILDEQRQKARSLVEGARDSLRGLGRETDERIRQILTPAQAGKYQKLQGRN